METQKIVIFLNDSSNKEPKFVTKNGTLQKVKTARIQYSQNNSVKCETESIKSSLCDYSDAFILVTGDILGTADNDADVVFKTCALFCACKTKINDVIIDEPNHIYMAMPMYNLIEYSDNCSDTSGRA